MRADKFTKVLLILIIFLLTALLIKPILTPTKVYSKKAYQYKTLSAGRFKTYDRAKEFEKALNKYAAEGWRLHSVCVEARGTIVILER